MANIIPLKDNTGAQFYPQTHEKAVIDSNGVNLQTKLQSITTPTYVTAWDGDSTPVVANIPAGVSVTYNTTTYTGTLAASASTANKTYLVSTGTTDNYNRYVTQLNGSTYSWQNLGSTEIDLDDYATKAELSQLDQEVTELKKEPKVQIQPTNYALLVDTITGKKYDSNALVSDAGYNSTTLTELDTDHDIYLGVSSAGTGIVQFFDKDKEPLSSLTGNWANPITRATYPAGSVYVAFSYPTAKLTADKFFASAYPIAVLPSGYSKILKAKGTRPRIYIHTTDTQAEIAEKMMQAVLTWDCDVYWDFGTYTFTTIWDWMKANWGRFAYRNNYELPIGGNCRYFFNNSTIIMANASSDSGVVSNSNLFGTARVLDSSFALYDGTFIRQSKGTYCVHEEGQNMDGAYVHEYHNITMKWEYNDSAATLGTCIGMGMGKHGEIIVDNCLLFSEQPNAADSAIFKSHGRNDGSSQVVTQFKITFKDCYIGTFINLGTMNANETCIAHICGNSMGADIDVAPSGAAQYTIYKHGNEIRT